MTYDEAKQRLAAALTATAAQCETCTALLAECSTLGMPGPASVYTSLHGPVLAWMHGASVITLYGDAAGKVDCWADNNPVVAGLTPAQAAAWLKEWIA